MFTCRVVAFRVSICSHVRVLAFRVSICSYVEWLHLECLYVHM